MLQAIGRLERAVGRLEEAAAAAAAKAGAPLTDSDMSGESARERATAALQSLDSLIAELRADG